MARVYPRAPLRAGLGGFALLRCKVQADGGVSDCTIISESPDGQGFGQAAVALTHVLRYAPVPNATFITIPIRFVPAP